MQERVWIVQILQMAEFRIFVTRMTSFRKEAVFQKIRIRALVIYSIALVSTTQLLLASTLLL